MPSTDVTLGNWNAANSQDDWLRRVLSGYTDATGYGKVIDKYNRTGITGSTMIGQGGKDAGLIGLGSLTNMLFNQGRLDPRMLASAQAGNARATQGQQDAIQGQAARSGMSGSGLYKALGVAAGSAGANRSANLNYQDMADSYQRQQQNLGLLNNLVFDKQRDYAAIGAGQYGVDKNAKTAQTSGIFQGLAGLLGGLL